ncbi:MAG: CocE/NonD family hydrolase [Mucilaginibacter sp.]|uniref:CocE/NonD family hydrolase n=1 Tax=Mucilaginibacter sp. TaxID=1882438 RepID=UPI0031A5B3F0
MKLRLLCALILLLPVYGIAQTADSAWMVNNYVKKERYIPMRDGVKLFTAIYMSKDSTHNIHPILFIRTPYSCAPYGKQWIPLWNVYVKAYLKEGYDVVFQDVRGRYKSEGEFMDIRPFNPNKKGNKDIDEASDAYDTIDWLIKHVAGNNTKVGAIGTSYGGFYTAMVGLSGHKAVKAISPQAPVTDWFLGDDVHHNGAFMLSDMFGFFVSGGFGVARTDTTRASVPALPNPTGDAYAYFLRTGALPNFSKIAAKRNVPFWNDLMQHPDYDSWWVARNDRNYAARIPAGTASLVVGGLFDAEDFFGALHLYNAIESQTKNVNKLVLGPWWHGQWGGSDKGDRVGNIHFGSNTSTWYQENVELSFFNHYLKDEASADTIAEATVFFTGENKWHRFDQWPLPGIRYTDMYLHKDGKLLSAKPDEANAYEEYLSDPAKPVPYTDGIHPNRTAEYMTDDQRFASRRTDVLSFESDALDKDVTLAGPVKADLKVSISTTDADFIVKLIDVFPDDFKYTDHDSYIMNGYQMMVRGEIFRGRYRNSFSKPEAFIPGKVTEIKYTLNDIAHVFKKGHRIMVQVQSSWFPLADRNPQQFINIYQAKDADFIKSTIRIHMSAQEGSKVVLPVIN